MHDPVRIVERVPTADEYLHLIASVGWRPRERRAVEVALQHTLYAVCATTEDRTIGFGRVIGDGALHFYLTDVVVSNAFRGRGYGRWMVELFLEHPDLQGLRRIALLTRDAQSLYEPFGFTVGVSGGSTYMEIRSPHAIASRGTDH